MHFSGPRLSTSKFHQIQEWSLGSLRGPSRCLLGRGSCAPRAARIEHFPSTSRPVSRPSSREWKSSSRRPLPRREGPEAEIRIVAATMRLSSNLSVSLASVLSPRGQRRRLSRTARHRHLHDVDQVRQLRHVPDGRRGSRSTRRRTSTRTSARTRSAIPTSRARSSRCRARSTTRPRRAEELPYYEKEPPEEPPDVEIAGRSGPDPSRMNRLQ